MPIFISYSHNDKAFVDRLAIQLVQRNVNVWLDRWELSVGDSLLDRVQEAVDGASALLVILSKSSTSSEWCKRELSAGLLRELEEKRVVVMPVMLEDCEVPVFARGKMYADFRKNFDEGFSLIVESIAKVTNPSLARFKDPQFHTDWSIDIGEFENLRALRLHFIQISPQQPYTCLTKIEIIASPQATKIFDRNKESEGEDYAKLHVVETLKSQLSEQREIKLRLEDENEKTRVIVTKGPARGEEYRVQISSRRLGEDTGRDIIINVTGLVSDCSKHMSDVLRKPKPGRQTP